MISNRFLSITFSFLFFYISAHANFDKLQEKILNEKPPQWMIDSIHEQLSPYKETGITSQMLDKTIKNAGKSYVLYKISGKNVTSQRLFKLENEYDRYHTNFRNNPILKGLKKIAALNLLPDMQFVITISDGFIGQPGSDFSYAPVFCFAKNVTRVRTGILFPDYENLEGFHSLRSSTISGSKQFPWDKKIEMGFFRGGGCGAGDYAKRNQFFEYPRFKAVAFSLQHPKMVNARFTGCGELKDHVGIKEYMYLSKSVKIEDQIRYKYQITIDGVTCAFSRVFWQLLANSVMLKQESKSIQWYYPGMKPYEHYIPLKDDVSDLIEKIQWAKDHDQECKKISENATLFAREWLGEINSLYYIYHVLKEYAKLQKF